MLSEFGSPRASPEVRSAEGSIATSSAGKREESSYHNQGGGPPLFELQRSPTRRSSGVMGVSALPKNPRDTATYEPVAADLHNTSGGAGGGATTPTNKLQRRLQQQQKHQQQHHHHQQQHLVTGGGSVKSANSWTSWGKKRPGNATSTNNITTVGSIGGRSYKSGEHNILLPPLKPPNNNTASSSSGGAGATPTIAMRNRTSSGSLKDLGKSPRKMNHHSHHHPHPPSSSFGSTTNVVPPGTMANNNNATNNNSNSSSSNSNNIGGSGNNQHHVNLSSHSKTTTNPPTSTHNNTTTSTVTNNNTTSQNNNPSSLDDEEQYMFEQRLTHDELGVAIRKISHSGKAQLRYVKCVVLRAPSSSDFGGGGGVVGISGSDRDGTVVPTLTSSSNSGGGGAGSIPGIGPYLDKTNGEAKQLSKKSQQQGDNVSVSSSVSSRFMDRIKSVVGRSSNAVMNTADNNHNNNASSSSVHGGEVNDEDDDNNSLLLHQDTIMLDPSSSSGPTTNSSVGGTHHHHHAPPSSSKSQRALTWGKKNAITIPLDKFTCVRKGKTTERTIRNGAGANRLLSIVVGGGGGGDGANNVDGTTTTTTTTTSTCASLQESLDIEAPTRLDRDKFASAFARFLGVPLIEEDECEVVERTGRSTPSGEFVSCMMFVCILVKFRSLCLLIDICFHPQNV